MRFSCNVGALVTEVGLLLSVAGRKATIVHLNQIHIRAEKERLVLTATDLDSTFRVRMPATVEKAGAITIDAKKLHGIAQSFDSKGTITFASEKDLWMAVESGGSKLRVPGLDADDFPKVEDPLASRRVVVSGQDLADLIRRASIGAPDSHPTYATMRLAITTAGDAGALSVTGLDGTRLSIATAAAAPAELEVLATRRDFDAVSKLLALEDASEVVMQRDDARAWFTVAERVLTIKVDHNKWPNVQKNIDEAQSVNAAAVMLGRQELSRALRRAELVAGDAEVGATVTFQMAPAQLRLVAANDQGEVLETFPVEYDGPEVEAQYASAKIREFLGVATADQIAYRINPRFGIGGIFEDKAANHVYLVMPKSDAKRTASSVPPAASKKKGAAA